MKRWRIVAALALLALLSGCFRQEEQVARYAVPGLRSDAVGSYLQDRLRRLPGIVESRYDTQAHTLTVTYKSSTIRKMNIEEAIAQAGFSVNGRPANPKAKLPAELKQTK